MAPDARGDNAPGISRRAVLGTAAVGAVAAAAGGAVGYRAAGPSPLNAASARYEFRGAHQSGILTPQQDHLHFASFDVTTKSRQDLVALLREWSEAAAALMAGRQLGRGAAGGPYASPPDDTGEALDLPASGLTITFGFGRSLFTQDGVDRFGLASRLPPALIELPHFPGDVLDPRSVGGDLAVQACANDPQVATHAIRNLSRIAFGRAAIRWAQLGFGRTSSTTRSQQTPRNLMGFKDGTNNLKAEDRELIESSVWASRADGAPWMEGGTYLVSRRIRILTDTWDRTSLGEQEALVGRTKASGAPLSGGTEFTPLDFDARGANGAPLIPTDSHVSLAHHDHSGVRMLRRGYNFADGADELGRLLAGLFFLAFVRDPGEQFVPLQRALSRSDVMTVEYLRTTGSALFAVPPGVTSTGAIGPSGAYIGQSLFA